MKAESPENPAEAVTPEEAIERRALARAQEEAREARRASLRFWTKTVCGLAAAAVVVLGAGRAADAVMHLPVFDFSTLEVEGDVARVPVERVKQAVEPVIRGNFFTEDLDEVRRAAETVPWVKRAVVRRVWPDGLRIAVETYSAFAVYEDGRLVDPDGVLFSANPDERDNPSDLLPNFYGPAGQTAQIARYYREFSRALSSIGATVTDVACSDRGGWSLVMASGDIPATRVELGREDAGTNIVAKVADLAAAYPRVVELMDGPPASIDLRYDRAFAATLPDREAIRKLREAEQRTDTDVPDEEPGSAQHDEQPE